MKCQPGTFGNWLACWASDGIHLLRWLQGFGIFITPGTAACSNLRGVVPVPGPRQPQQSGMFSRAPALCRLCCGSASILFANICRHITTFTETSGVTVRVCTIVSSTFKCNVKDLLHNVPVGTSVALLGTVTLFTEQLSSSS